MLRVNYKKKIDFLKRVTIVALFVLSKHCFKMHFCAQNLTLAHFLLFELQSIYDIVMQHNMLNRCIVLKKMYCFVNQSTRSKFVKKMLSVLTQLTHKNTQRHCLGMYGHSPSIEELKDIHINAK